MTMPKRPRANPGNLILNSPYEEPGFDYATEQTGNLEPDRRLPILTDEAHHCYLPKASNAPACRDT